MSKEVTVYKNNDGTEDIKHLERLFQESGSFDGYDVVTLTGEFPTAFVIKSAFSLANRQVNFETTERPERYISIVNRALADHTAEQATKKIKFDPNWVIDETNDNVWHSPNTFDQ